MSLDNNEVVSMDEAMGHIESSMKTVRRGEIVKGKVISVTADEAIVNLGYMSDAVLTKNEVSEDADVNLKELIKENDEIYVYIVDMNNGEGNIVVSKKIADREKTWEEMQGVFTSANTFEVVVKEVVKGGGLAYINGIRAFIPASQLSTSYVKDLNEFVGKTLNVRIIELDREKQKLVLSRREVEKEELQGKKEKIWESLKPGEKRKGVVSRLAKFGAFVDLGGLDGLIHISQLSWNRVNDPSEVVSVGDQVEVYVLEADRKSNRISLALKDVNENPWSNAVKKYSIGDIVEGTVTKILDFGVFVEIEPSVEGLVHISEISEERIVKISDVLAIGQKIKVKVLNIDEKEKRISLTIKDAEEKSKEEIDKYIDKESGTTLGDLFKDKLKNFKFD